MQFVAFIKKNIPQDWVEIVSLSVNTRLERIVNLKQSHLLVVLISESLIRLS